MNTIQAVLNVLKVVFLGVLLIVFFAAAGGSSWLLGDAAIIYRYAITNGSGEPIVCAVVGYFPNRREPGELWQPAPNVKGPSHNLRLAPGETVQIALTTSDFSQPGVLVRGSGATETKWVDCRHFEVRIPPLAECPVASAVLLPCFAGDTVAVPPTR